MLSSSLSLGNNKKRRLEENEDVETDDEFLEQVLKRNDMVIDTLVDTLDAIETTSCSDDPWKIQRLVRKASTTFVNMKSIQRRVFDIYQRSQSAMSDDRHQLMERQIMNLECLNYEQSHLDRQLSTDVSTPYLERMCREETQQTTSTTTTTTDNDDNDSMLGNKRQIMNMFLCGNANVPYDDPARYSTVLGKLHDEINLRGTLERDTLQAQRELETKRRSLGRIRAFLDEFPRKLQQVERASLPLQKFFASSVSNSGNQQQQSAMVDRTTQRLEMASSSLPSPLYTLYWQLQSYIDLLSLSSYQHKEDGQDDGNEKDRISIHVITTTTTTTGRNKRNKSTTATASVISPSSPQLEEWFQPDPTVVQLRLTLPDIRDNRKMSTTTTKQQQQVVTIDFRYLSKLGIVTAQASSSSSAALPPDGRVHPGSLLRNLFPNDEGNMMWWYSSAAAAAAAADGSSTATTTRTDLVKDATAAASEMSGRPYHWCNYLAGIRLVPPPAAAAAASRGGSGSGTAGAAPMDPISTMAIVKTLLRRLDANATLSYILSTLKKRPSSIPLHPSWKTDTTDSSSSPVLTKLVGWTEETGGGDDPSPLPGTSSSSGSATAHIKTFVATLKRKTSKLRATVRIDMSQYPSVPPQWSVLTGGGGSSSMAKSTSQESWGEQYGSVESLEERTNPLYDNALGQIERTVNSQLHTLVQRTVDETYNWILAHQVDQLIRLWDDHQRAWEQGERRAAGQVPRSIKGKDRVVPSPK